MNSKQLKQKFKQLKPLPDTNITDPWLKNRISIRREVVELNPEEFLTWPTVKATMFIGQTKLAEKRLLTIFDGFYSNETKWPGSLEPWVDAIEYNPFGNSEFNYHHLFGEISDNR